MNDLKFSCECGLSGMVKYTEFNDQTIQSVIIEHNLLCDLYRNMTLHDFDVIVDPINPPRWIKLQHLITIPGPSQNVAPKHLKYEGIHITAENKRVMGVWGLVVIIAFFLVLLWIWGKI